MPKIVAFALEVFPLGETTLVCSAKIVIIMQTTKFKRLNSTESLKPRLLHSAEHFEEAVAVAVADGDAAAGEYDVVALHQAHLVHIDDE